MGSVRPGLRIKILVGVIVLTALATSVFLNPIRVSYSAKAPTESIAYDEQISIPKIAGGPGSLNPPVPNTVSDEARLPTGWTPLENGNYPGQLLVDVASVRLWRKVERYASFQYIPKPGTTDENFNKPILNEEIHDAFKCSEGTAEKISLAVYYEDGTGYGYYPWGHASAWQRVSPDTALGREMKFVCAVHLTAESPASANLDQGRILGTWHMDWAQGRIAAGQIVISETNIAWTSQDNHACVSDYALASRSTGPTFPGGPIGGTNSDHAYTTFVLELKGPHLQPCSQWMNSITVSLASARSDFANFAAFFRKVQGHGTMHRVSPIKTFP
jgi:hypothetical protein